MALTQICPCRMHWVVGLPSQLAAMGTLPSSKLAQSADMKLPDCIPGALRHLCLLCVLLPDSSTGQQHFYSDMHPSSAQALQS